jgi:ParB-like chromosome segregation protein Spo0J
MKVANIIRVPEIEAEFPKPNNYDDIKADIAQRGIQESIVVNASNQLLCGYTRLSIAEELGIEEIPHRTVEITEIDAMIEYAILDNIRRRHLTALQLVEYGIKLEKLYEGRQGRPEKGAQNEHLFEGKTRDLVASQITKQTGKKLSGPTYERLKTIATKAAPEVKQKFNEHQITQQAALEIVKLDNPSEQIEILNEYSNTKDIEQAVKAKRQKTAKADRLKPKLDRLKDLIKQGIYIGSVWSFGKRVNYAGDANFHGNSPTQIVENTILLYTNEGDTVLDPMAGSGTVPDVCQATNRICRAFDLSPVRDDIETQDARQMDKVADNSIDFIFWHPPYWDLVKYSDKEADLSQMTWEAFNEAIAQIISECYRILKPEKFICILTGDRIKDKRFYPISWNIANIAQAKFVPYGIAIKTTEGATSQIVKGKIIWAEVAATQNLKIEHDFILVFRKC